MPQRLHMEMDVLRGLKASHDMAFYRLLAIYAPSGWHQISALRKTLFPCSIECGINVRLCNRTGRRMRRSLYGPHGGRGISFPVLLLSRLR
jgi:hypothetical protein